MPLSDESSHLYSSVKIISKKIEHIGKIVVKILDKTKHFHS